MSRQRDTSSSDDWAALDFVHVRFIVLHQFAIDKIAYATLASSTDLEMPPVSYTISLNSVSSFLANLFYDDFF